MKNLLIIFIAFLFFAPYAKAQESVADQSVLNDGTTLSEVNIYPIPAIKFFIVDTPPAYIGGKIIVTDVVGKQVRLVILENNPKIKILTNEIPAGIYFVSIEYKDEKVFTKRIVIDK